MQLAEQLTRDFQQLPTTCFVPEGRATEIPARWPGDDEIMTFCVKTIQTGLTYFKVAVPFFKIWGTCLNFLHCVKYLLKEPAFIICLPRVIVEDPLPLNWVESTHWLDLLAGERGVAWYVSNVCTTLYLYLYVYLYLNLYLYLYFVGLG